MTIWLNPSLFFIKKNVTPNKLLFFNLFVLLFAMMFLELWVANVLDIHQPKKIIGFFLVATFITIPFYYIINFIFSVLLGIILVILKKDFSVLRLYTVVLSANSFIFLFNAATLYIIWINNAPQLFYTLTITLLLIVNILYIRILYFGLVNYVGVTKKISFIIAAIILFITFSTTSYGVVHYAS